MTQRPRNATRGLTLARKLDFYTDMTGPIGACWLWTGIITRKGYGRLKWRGKCCPAHRLSWENAHGEVPEGMHVCHRCDVRRCVNPSHLFLGSHQENMEDMAAKGRAGRTFGEMHPNCRLTDAQVVAIRSDKRRQRIIAADFGIGQQQVSRIKAGQQRQHGVKLRDEP